MGACSISGTTDEEGGSCYGKEKKFSVAPGVGSSLMEGVFV